MPAGSPVGPYQKIDAALNDGAQGPDNLIEAITDDLGIPINHYIELNFDGFEQTVNAIYGSPPAPQRGMEVCLNSLSSVQPVSRSTVCSMVSTDFAASAPTGARCMWRTKAA